MSTVKLPGFEGALQPIPEDVWQIPISCTNVSDTTTQANQISIGIIQKIKIIL